MEEHGWPDRRADGAIAEYLRFLQLLASAPRMELVASDDVDLVWHEHLLDTQNYAADTKRLFGRFLHHRRARSAQEVSDIPSGYARTKEAYRARFGREPPAQFWGATTAAASMCGGGGSVDPSETGPVTGSADSDGDDSSNVTGTSQDDDDDNTSGQDANFARAHAGPAGGLMLFAAAAAAAWRW